MSGEHRRTSPVKALVLFLTLLLACGLAACSRVPPQHPQVRKPCLVVVMFDLSASVKEARPDYERMFSEKILMPDEHPYDLKSPVNPDVIDAEDIVYVSEINTSSQTAAKAWLDETLPTRVLPDWYRGNPKQEKKDGQAVKEKVEEEKAKMKNTVRQNLATRDPEGTSMTGIIASTRNAAAIFERRGNCSTTHKCILVLFTDGVEESGEANFNQGKSGSLPATAEDVNRILDGLERAQRLTPGSLKDVDVYVAGATGGSGVGDTSSEFLAIKRFWRAYFERTGAKVVEYGHDLIKVSLQ